MLLVVVSTWGIYARSKGSQGRTIQDRKRVAFVLHQYIFHNAQDTSRACGIQSHLFYLVYVTAHTVSLHAMICSRFSIPFVYHHPCPAQKAAANAMTVLVKAGYSFAGANLARIKVNVSVYRGVKVECLNFDAPVQRLAIYVVLCARRVRNDLRLFSGRVRIILVSGQTGDLDSMLAPSSRRCEEE